MRRSYKYLNVLGGCHAWFLTLTLMALFVCAQCRSSNLVLELRAVDSVATTDSVLVDVSFRNAGDSDVVLYCWRARGKLVQASMGGLLQFDVVRDDSVALSYSRAGIVPMYPYTTDTLVLAQGQSHVETINLTSFYSEPRAESEIIWDSPSVWGRRQWSPGKYSIRCKYEYYHKQGVVGGADLWEGSVSSDVILLTVE